MDRPTIALISTGGTIDSVGADALDLVRYHRTGRRVPVDDLLEGLPELVRFAEVRPIPFRRLSSSGITGEDWLDLRRAVLDALGEGCDGVVITHGTNSIEETAFFLDLTLRVPTPVVLVGAMRPPSALGADGGLNLLRSVQVAASPQARDHGVLVVMNDTIFAARDVTKTATSRVHALAAPDLGPLGYADADGQVVFYHRHLHVGGGLLGDDLGSAPALPRVDVVVSHVGADGVLIDATVAAGARGLVVSGFGNGRVTPAQDDALVRAGKAGLVVCMSTRAGSGRALRHDDRRRWVMADNMQPWKARIALSLALTHTSSPAEVQSLIDASEGR